MRVTGTERNANYLILGAFALFAIWPIVGIVVAGLQPEGDAPGGLANLEQAWQIGRFGGYLRTSVMVSAKRCHFETSSPSALRPRRVRE